MIIAAKWSKTWKKRENMKTWVGDDKTLRCRKLIYVWGYATHGGLFLRALLSGWKLLHQVQLVRESRVDTDGGIHKTCHPWEKKFWAHDSENV